MDFILQPWPWYITGPLVGLSVPLLLLLTGKSLGISSSLQHIGSACMPNSKLPYLSQNNWRKNSWNLIFVAGIILGGFIASQFLSAEPVRLLPAELSSGWGLVQLAVGGFLVGFGTRYANGCTSGHTIMGISLLNWPSLAATAAFFAGGLFMTFLATTFFS